MIFDRVAWVHIGCPIRVKLCHENTRINVIRTFVSTTRPAKVVLEISFEPTIDSPQHARMHNGKLEWSRYEKWVDWEMIEQIWTPLGHDYTTKGQLLRALLKEGEKLAKARGLL